MTDKTLLKTFRLNEKLVTLIIHAMIALMMVCVGYATMLPIQRFIPGWRLAYLPGICLVISIEAMVTWRTTRRSTDVNVDMLVFRGIEWVVILICIKLLLYLWQPANQIWLDISSWQDDFFTNFFKGEYPIVVLVTFCVWLITGLYAIDMAELEGDEALLNTAELDGVMSDRGAVRRHIAGRVLFFGFLVALFVALANIDINSQNVLPHISNYGLLAVVIYFLLGFGLLSQTYFALLRASWAWERVSISPELAKRWSLFSLIFFVVIAVLAIALPTSYTLGLLTTLGYVLEIVVRAITLVVVLIFSLLAIPITLILNLLSRLLGGVLPRLTIPYSLPFVLPPRINDNAPVPWLDVLKSVFFWGIFIGVVGYAFYQYIRQNQALLGRIRRLPFWTWMVQTWHKLWQRVQGINEQIGEMVKTGLKRLRPEQVAQSINIPERFISLRQFTPREKVLFFYLALVRRSGERGFARQPSQTPYEYNRVLKAKIPEAGQDLQAITEEFIEARYSHHDISEDDAGLVKQAWERIRRAIIRMPKGRV